MRNGRVYRNWGMGEPSEFEQSESWESFRNRLLKEILGFWLSRKSQEWNSSEKFRIFTPWAPLLWNLDLVAIVIAHPLVLCCQKDEASSKFGINWWKYYETNYGKLFVFQRFSRNWRCVLPIKTFILDRRYWKYIQ